MHPAARDSHAQCVRVCMCVFVRARARPFEPPPSTRHTAHSTVRRLVPCVTSEREEEDYKEEI